jgi:osmoprotectant transport system permease protein
VTAEGAANEAAQGGGRRVHLLLVVLGVAALTALPFLSHAPNRLLSGRPVGFGQTLALTGAMAPGVALVVAALGLLAPLLWPQFRIARVLALLATCLVAGTLTWLAGRGADALAASGSPSSRTSLGGGAWIALGATLLIAAEGIQRLRLGTLLTLLAAAAVVAPIAVLLSVGALDQLSLLKEYQNQRDVFLDALVRHLVLVVGALIPTLLIGVPLGVAGWRREKLRRAVFPVLNIVQTIPSIALFGILMAPLSGLAAWIPVLAQAGISGVGIAPAVIALVLYSLLPVVRNTVEGLAGVPADVRDAAMGMGMTTQQTFWRVDVPLALPVILTGVRVTAVQAVGLAAISALIGAGGLGAIMFQGLFANALDLVLLGAVPVILLAVLVDAVFRVLTTLFAPGAA